MTDNLEHAETQSPAMKLGERATDFLSQYSTRAIVIGFNLIVAVMLVLLVFTLYRINGIGETYNEIAAEHNRHASLAYKMSSTARDRTNLLLEIAYDTDPFSQDEKVQLFHELGAEFGKARKALLGFQLVPEENALLERQRAFTQSACTCRSRSSSWRCQASGVKRPGC